MQLFKFFERHIPKRITDLLDSSYCLLPSNVGLHPYYGCNDSFEVLSLNIHSDGGLDFACCVHYSIFSYYVDTKT